MSAPWALPAAAMAMLLWPGARSAVGRLDAPPWSDTGAPGRAGDPGAPPARAGRCRRLLFAALLGLALVVALGGPLGWCTGLSAAVMAWRRLAADPEAAGRTARRLAALPGCVDLLAVCLDAGLPLESAVRQVAAAVGEPLRSDLVTVAALQELGAAPATAWASWREQAGLASVARAVLRSAHSGAVLSASLRAVALEVRAEQVARGEAAVRRCGVLVLAPLGLCFLPAFVCLGVVPIVLGIAETVLR